MWPIVIGTVIATAVGTFVSRFIEKTFPPPPKPPQPVIIVKPDPANPQQYS